MSLNELSTDGLSAKALALISEFALIVYREEGTVIDVHADDVLLKVFSIGCKSRNLRLRSIYLHLRTESATNIAIARSGGQVVPFDPVTKPAPGQTSAYGDPLSSSVLS